MRGRAGRKGKDEVGESFICCEKADLEEVAQLMEANLPPIESGLVADKRGMLRQALQHDYTGFCAVLRTDIGQSSPRSGSDQTRHSPRSRPGLRSPNPALPHRRPHRHPNPRLDHDGRAPKARDGDSRPT